MLALFAAPGLDALMDWQFMRGLGAPYAEAMGLAPFMLIAMTGISGAIYLRTGSVMLPVGLLFLTGGALVPLLPSVGVMWLVVLVVLVGFGLFAYLYLQRA